MFSLQKAKGIVNLASIHDNKEGDCKSSNMGGSYTQKASVPNKTVPINEINNHTKNVGQSPFIRRGSPSAQSGGTGTAGKGNDQSVTSQTKINQVYKPTGHISRSLTSAKVEEVRLRSRASLKSPRRSPSPEKRPSKMCKSGGKNNQVSLATVITKL